MALLELTRYCDSLLRIGEIDDWPNALNGLQIENSGRLKKIGAGGRHLYANTRSRG